MARICLIRQGYFFDPRVRNEVDALLEAGHDVDVLCLRFRDESRHHREGRLRIRRLSLPNQRGGWATYLFKYATFLLVVGVIVSWRQLRRPYQLIQVNGLPDSLVLAAALPHLLGARVLIDMYECMPEFFATKFKVSPQHPLVRLVAGVEQAAIRFADAAITCTEPMRRVFLARGAPPKKIAVVMNSYDLGLGAQAVRPHGSTATGRFTIICHGTVEERYGLDTALQALALLTRDIPELHLAIYGDGSYLPELRRIAAELDIEDRVSFSNGWVPVDELIQAIDAAAVGLVAIKRDLFRDLTLCTKMFDFIGLRKPAIVSRTASVAEYFGESCFVMFTAGDPQDLARAIREIYSDAALGRRLLERAITVARPYRWTRQRERYLGIVDELIRARKADEHDAQDKHDAQQQQPVLGSLRAARAEAEHQEERDQHQYPDHWMRGGLSD